MSRWGLALLRWAVGAVFVAHGLLKLIPIWGSSPATAVALLESVDVTPAYPLTLAVGGLELLCGMVLTREPTRPGSRWFWWRTR